MRVAHVKTRQSASAGNTRSGRKGKATNERNSSEHARNNSDLVRNSSAAVRKGSAALGSRASSAR